ncbi:MAG: hypothetical protein WDA27_03130 [Actinomycetota bacterium]
MQKQARAMVCAVMVALATIAAPIASSADSLGDVASGAEQLEPGAFGTEEWKDPARSLFPNPGDVGQLARRVFGGRFAGVWIERPSDASERDRTAWLNVSVVDLAASDEEYVREVTNGNDYVRVLGARYGEATLSEWRDNLAGYLTVQGKRDWFVTADAPSNLVIVQVGDPPEGLVEYARVQGIPDAAWRLVREPGGS